MPRLKLRIKVTARSKVKQVHFLIRIAIRVTCYLNHSNNVKYAEIKNRNVEINSLWNVIAIMGWKNVLSAKNSDFGVYVSYVKYFKDIFSHALVIWLSERMLVLFDW